MEFILIGEKEKKNISLFIIHTLDPLFLYEDETSY